jgi:hypothetical protein
MLALRLTSGGTATDPSFQLRYRKAEHECCPRMYEVSCHLFAAIRTTRMTVKEYVDQWYLTWVCVPRGVFENILRRI